jgi:hypothetical protein
MEERRWEMPIGMREIIKIRWAELERSKAARGGVSERSCAALCRPRPRRERRIVATAVLAASLALAFVRPPLHATPRIVMSGASSGSKRDAEPIDLGSTDEDEPAPKRPARPSGVPPSLPSGASELRGVTAPPGWTVHGGSLLVRAFGAPQPSSSVAAFDFDDCLVRPQTGARLSCRVVACTRHAFADVFGPHRGRRAPPSAVSTPTHGK